LAHVRRLLSCVAALAFGLASSLLVACGDRNGLLPAHKANAMIADLASLSNAVAQQDCAGASSAVIRARNALHSASTANPTLTDRLGSELARLDALAQTECHPVITAQPTVSTTTPTTTSTTQSTTTTTPPTTSTTTTTTPTTTSSTTATTQTTDTNGGASPGNGNGSGGAGGGSGGGGGNGGQ
jgi:hypothetical protein